MSVPAKRWAAPSTPIRSRIKAGYTLNIGGSLAGILGFSLLSWLQTPPVVWFAVACGGVAWLLYARVRSYASSAAWRYWP